MLIAWVPAAHRSDSEWRTLAFSREVQVTNLQNAKTRKVSAGQPVVLNDAPVSIAGLPPELVQEARTNTKLNFPWGGDYSSAKSISFQAGRADQLHGVFPRNRSSYPTVTFSDGSSGLVVQALIADLEERGRLDETLVVMMGDFGRTPKINGGAGRNHYPYSFSVVLAGGGIRGGQVYGSSDKIGAFPHNLPCGRGDLHATIFQAMGISPDALLYDNLRRPHKICAGRPLPLS